MSRLKDEEDPAEARITSRLGCIFSWFRICCAKVREAIRDKLESLKWKIVKFWKENRLVIRPCWDIVLILGAAWFFFSIQREMLCWHQTCVKHDTCGAYFKCNHKSSRNIKKLVELCPMKPENSTVFGIFVNPLGTTSREPINFSTKFSYSFWWGVRNLSNFGTNLQTSTFLWENWFASLISIIGLLLFVYLIGNNVQTYMQMTTTKTEEEAERMRQKFLHQQTRINLWMGRNFDSYLRKEIETKMREKYQENKEVNLDNVLTLLSLLGPDDQMYARDKICQKMLESVPVFKDMGLFVLSAISKKMEKVEYLEDTSFVKMDHPLDRMVFITEGSMGIYTTSTADSSPSTIIQGSLEECSIYGHEPLLSWAFSPNVSLDCLPISKKTVKCHTKVEGFVLTASDLKAILSSYCIIEDSTIYGDEDHDVEISNSTDDQGESSSSNVRSAILVARAVSHFRRRIRSKKPELDFDPSSYKGL